MKTIRPTTTLKAAKVATAAKNRKPKSPAPAADTKPITTDASPPSSAKTKRAGTTPAANPPKRAKRPPKSKPEASDVSAAARLLRAQRFSPVAADKPPKPKPKPKPKSKPKPKPKPKPKSPKSPKPPKPPAKPSPKPAPGGRRGSRR